MNVFHAKLMTYYEIHRMRREGHSISQISEYLVLNRRTVSKYLAMNEQEYEAFLVSQSDRKCILDPFEEFVVRRLKSFPGTSSAQMYDWLKEEYSKLPKVDPKTVFNFVSKMRGKYNIPIASDPRQCMIVEELPMGQQGQADFGEVNLRDTAGKRVKVSFLAMVLSRSRYKYAWFVKGHFTTELTITGHDKGFAYFMGVPDEMVYDQDRVLLKDENHGDLILTDGFRAYAKEVGFNLHFCRKADPQSKGKVENLVKYIKQNFLYNRTFHNIETLNDEALAWLGRTANAMPHAFTRKEPVSQWHIERDFLRPYVPHLPVPIPLLDMTVRKDNTVSYKGNLYSLPLGSYKGRGTSVNGKIESGQLIITAKPAAGLTNSGREFCRHVIAEGRGQKVINTDHKRDKTSAITEMVNQISGLLIDPEQGQRWMNAIRADKPRYIRDQLIIIRKAIEGASDPALISKAVSYCEQNSILIATDFKAVLSVYEQEEKDQLATAKIVRVNPLNSKMPDAALNSPEMSAIKDYEAIVKGTRSAMKPRKR